MKHIMKKIILVFILLANIVIAQDKYPEPFKFNYKANGIQYNNIPLDSSKFIQNNFYLSTQWGGHPRMLKALKMNANMNTYPTGPSVVEYNDSTDGKLFYIYEGGEDNASRGFQYEPTLIIPENQRGDLLTRNGQIFGFANVKGEIITDENDPNFDRLVLDTNGTYVDTVVLSKTWINNQYLNERDPDKPLNRSLDGTLWTFSINLRRINKNELRKDTSSGRVPILSIRLPFTKIKMSGYNYIKFDSTSNYLSNKDLLSYSPDGINTDTLGYSLKQYLLNNDTTTHFVIYDDMLPDSLFFVNNKRQDITINASFICDGFSNTLLKKNETDSARIDNLDIEVKYHGNTNIAINYLRIMTPHALKFIKGETFNGYRTHIQNMITHVEGRGYEIFAMYGQDEYHEEYFSGQKYNAHLLNFQTYNEGAGGDHFKHYEEHIKPKNHWIGANGIAPQCGAPYFGPNTLQYHEPKWVAEYGSDVKSRSKEWMNYQMGFTGNWTFHTYPGLDSLKSTYETDMRSRQDWAKLRDDTSYTLLEKVNKFSNSISTLMYIDYTNYASYYKHPEYLFKDKYWWTNSYPVGNFSADSNGSVYLSNNRPKTAEEVRMTLWNRIIFGTKGILYDARVEKVDNFNGKGKNTNITTGFIGNTYDPINHDNFPYDELINTDSPLIGGDFIPAIDSSSHFTDFVNRDTAAKYLRVPKDRIYYGRKSPRLEMYKLHNWIRANETELMNLRLQSTFSKGTLVFENQHPDSAIGLINKFVQLDRRQIIYNNDSTQTFVSDSSIKTRPIGRMKNGSPHYETYDSTFFDFTIHKHKDKSMDSVFYIGILNKRTDPLIMMDSLTNDKHLLFLTDDEFGKLCRNGGYDPTRIDSTDLFYDSTYWQSKWWKRLGARELTIPLNYSFTTEGKETTFKVTELGTKDTTYMKNWWLGSKYHHTIDTAIYKNGNIVMRFLPGEGKILKVEISRKPQPFKGDLTYSNQRKLIAYPKVDTVKGVFFYNDPKSVMTSIDTVVYHLTYQRNDSIFYAKSFPMHKDFPTEHIAWQLHVNVSRDSAYHNGVGIAHSGDTAVTNNVGLRRCHSPSIVVRTDTTETNIEDRIKAYICYTCIGSRPSHGYTSPVLVENIINVKNPTTINLTASNPRLIGKSYDSNSTSTINASYNGNFYAWSDSTVGIRVGWKEPHNTRFMDSIKHKIIIKGESFSQRFRHPSLNTYSRVQLEECNSALVWQEFNNIYGPIPKNNIYYTRLQLNSSGYLYNYVTQTKCDTFPLHNFRYSGDNKSLVLTNNVCLDNKLPMVYRGIENNVDYFIPNDSIYDPHRALKHDRIYWEGINYNGIDKVIYYAGVDNFDIKTSQFIYEPDCMRNMGPSLLRHQYNTLKNPNIAQGEIYGYYDLMGVKQYKNVNLPSGVVDKHLVLNFTEFDDNAGTHSIWHVQHGYFSLINDWSTFVDDFTNSKVPYKLNLDYARLPQLAALPYMNDDKTMNLGRRVYQSMDGGLSTIETSLEYFYKGERKKEPIKLQFFGYEDGENATFISPVMVRGVVPLMNKNSVYEYNEKTHSNRVKDTIKTDWLVINDIEDIEFVSEEINNKTMRMFVEVEGQKDFFDIHITKGNKAKLNKMRIINGNNKRIRFVWTKLNNNSKFQEQVVLTDDIVGKFYKTSENQRNMVFDLGINTQKEYIGSDNLLSLFPNPVDNELFITINLPLSEQKSSHTYKYNIMNIYGQVVFESEIMNKVTEVVNTSNLNNGTYFINFINLDDEIQILDKSNKFIINR